MEKRCALSVRWEIASEMLYAPNPPVPDADFYRTASVRCQVRLIYVRDKPLAGVTSGQGEARKRGAAGGGAGRSWAWGDGGAETRGAAGGPAAPKVALQSLLQGAAQCPESSSMMPGAVRPVDSPLGSIIPGTKVPLQIFASLPLYFHQHLEGPSLRHLVGAPAFMRGRSASALRDKFRSYPCALALGIEQSRG
jgi:hypothetical protein